MVKRLVEFSIIRYLKGDARVLFESIVGFIGSFLEIIHRHLREKPELKIEMLECNWANLPENGSQVFFKLNVDNRGDRGTSITQVRLAKFDGKDVERQDWVLQTEAQTEAYPSPRSLPRKDLPAHSSIELKGFFSFGKHLEGEDYPLEIEISHTHGTQTIKATAKSGFPF